MDIDPLLMDKFNNTFTVSRATKLVLFEQKI
jgi:hypothetical protein